MPIDPISRLSSALRRLAFVTLLAALSTSATAATTEGQAGEPLTVGIADCPPFVMMQDGQPTGLAVYLWERVAGELGLQWNYRHYPLGHLLEILVEAHPDDLPDVGISCTSVTAEREALIDFSHSFFETHTAIAVRETSVWGGVKALFTNPIVLRFDVNPEASLSDHAGATRDVVNGALAHQMLPFDKLVQVLNPPRDPLRIPLVSIMFNLQRAFLKERRYGSVELVSVQSHSPVRCLTSPRSSNCQTDR